MIISIFKRKGPNYGEIPYTPAGKILARIMVDRLEPARGSIIPSYQRKQKHVEISLASHLLMDDRQTSTLYMTIWDVQNTWKSGVNGERDAIQ